MRRGTKRKASRKDEAGKSKEETKKQPNNEIAEEDEKEPSQSQPAIEENSKADANDNSAKDEENKVETSSKQAQEKPSKALKQRAKRAKISKPEAEPEYFEDQRNMEDLWKQTFPVGTEWEQLDLVYQYNWSFRNLEDAFEEGGELYGKRVYLFGCTEPQFLSFKDEQKVIVIPVVVAVVSPFPPSDKLGITSVQRESEEIVPMKQMKMDWVPYIPLENRESQVERLKSQIFILGCTQRRAGLRHLKEDRVKKFQYCLPYFYQPFKEDELEQSTEVQILYPDTEPPTVCSFDWELDEYEEFIDKLIEEEVLPSDKKDDFQKFVEEKVAEAKKANREARRARKKALEEMSSETKAAFENMQFYKFYPVPTSDSPDVSSVKSPFINRYYGKAHKVL
ncbi:hypothetical protein M9H77_19824 [Catharanthus roseus]|uniref:Uncharacterized protein n=1 Tax=Catharanthus roseus TaxID=4058 RepID=A0ACC0BBF7_CATRO|nr:hypothetical protein M9H77_19824 [Catharanthus roseus]